MNFLLKIVEGPNKGAEIALVEGVAVTLGKGDDCDIALADATLPDAPLTILAAAGGVSVDGEALAPFAVKTVGSTSIATGPADAPWGELVWPKPEKPESAEEEAPKAVDPGAPGPEREEAAPAARPRRGGCFGCLAVLLLLLLAFVAGAWFFRDEAKDFCRANGWGFSTIRGLANGFTGSSASESAPAEAPSLSDVAGRYGLQLRGSGDDATVFGNLATRRERLAATAELYAARPGVELDISDDESFRTSAEDALFTLTEGALKVASATNRTLSITGVSPSAAALKSTLMALNADLPKLRDADVSGVRIGVVAVSEAEPFEEDGPVFFKSRRRAKRAVNSPVLPVCGILTVPYPCLITRDGKRYLEGAMLGDSVIVKIEADSVSLTNSTGRFTWKP